MFKKYVGGFNTSLSLEVKAQSNVKWVCSVWILKNVRYHNGKIDLTVLKHSTYVVLMKFTV